MQIKNRGFTLIELIITIAIIGILTVVFFVSASIARSRAKEAKYISYVAQVKTVVDGLAQMDAYKSIPNGTWGCLGDYSSFTGGVCWEDISPDMVNNSSLDNVFKTLSPLPKGEVSPYNPRAFGVYHGIGLDNGKRVLRIYAFVGQDETESARTTATCNRFFGEGQWTLSGSLGAYCYWTRFLN